MATLNAYLNFNGNTEEAFEFYRSVFGGQFISLQRFRETPAAAHTPAGDLDKIMHVALAVGGGMLMGTDSLESIGQKLMQGNNVYLFLTPESESEAVSLFDALSKGGKIEQPLEKMFWGSLFGSFRDKFGVQWMVNYEFPKS
ncbi:MAG: VOC family protein [Bacteroidota bacterium]